MCLHILCHTDNEFLKFIVGQVLWTHVGGGQHGVLQRPDGPDW